jgi:hypothetical protein
LLEEGLVWRVGNGEQIQIWDDKWLHNTTSHQIQSSINELDSTAKVSTLIEPSSGW